MASTRMIICEATTDELAREVIVKMVEHVRTLTGLIKHSILVEEGGRMVILITDWPNREQCLAYYASRAYRQLVAGTQHMLVGDYVVKLFHNRTNPD
jgi:quinol monooxygenase YgiN